MKKIINLQIFKINSKSLWNISQKLSSLPPYPNMNAQIARAPNIIFIISIIVGAVLRVYQLGKDSFWNDEAGVALAALEPSIAKTIQVAQQHVMGMPLDYVIAWVMIRIANNEMVLRLPAVIFSVLTIMPYYFLSKNFFGKDIANWCIFILSIHPLHIHYSQELRFYSGLIFFYIASIYYQIKFIEHTTYRDYIILNFVTLLGIYYHVYILFTLPFGFLWIYIQKKKIKLKILFLLLISGIFCMVGFLPGYYFFGYKQSFNFPLLIWSDNIFSEIMRGIGWLSLPYCNINCVGIIYYTLSFLFTLIGIFLGLQKFPKQTILVIILISLNVALIITTDSLKGYFLVYRQFLYLLPLSIMLTSLGVQNIFKKTRKASRLTKITLYIVILIFFSTNLIALKEYYFWNKSNAKEVCYKILSVWDKGNEIIVYPGYSSKIYYYYFKTLGYGELLQYIKPAENLNNLPLYDDGTLIILINSIKPYELAHLKEALRINNFYPLLSEGTDNWLGHLLYIRSSINQ